MYFGCVLDPVNKNTGRMKILKSLILTKTCLLMNSQYLRGLFNRKIFFDRKF